MAEIVVAVKVCPIAGCKREMFVEREIDVGFSAENGPMISTIERTWKCECGHTETEVVGE